MFDTPIVLLIFNRPDMTKQVFTEISKVRPRKLFIIADGPRSHVRTDANRVLATRAVVEQIHWDCDVFRQYADINLGLRHRISSGLNWVFEQVETAIILEDDCVPHPTFFTFCEEMLNHYADTPQVMHITGANFGYKRKDQNSGSYYFSIYAHVWGWATWRRAWSHYDVAMSSWSDPNNRHRVLSKIPWWLRHHWQYIFQSVANQTIDTWAYQWMFSCLVHDGLCVMPYENTISNVGATADSTHRFSPRSSMIERPLVPIDFPLDHLTSLQINRNAVRSSSFLIWQEGTRLGRLYQRLRTTLNSVLS